MSALVFDAEIHQGAVAPYALFYTVTTTDSAFDLSTATSASFDVRRESGNPDSWSATIEVGATATSATIKHTFVAGDVDTIESLVVVPRLTTPGGDILGVPKTLRVKTQYD